MPDKKIYEEFIEWLGNTWWELPESKYLLPMFKANFNPEEAKFLTDFPFEPTSLEKLADLKGMDTEKLKSKLKVLGEKGMIYKSARGDSVRYRLNDTFFSLMRANLWPGLQNERAKESSPMINKYYLDGWFDQYRDVHYKGLRALPIEETVEDTRQIVPFEDIVKVIDSFEYYTVSTCPCRHRHNLDPDMPECKHPTEVCLHFDELGHYIVEHGLGREITKKETVEILKMAADSGLVHGISNWKEKPDTICNCCSCCCLFLESYHKLGHGKSLDPSNYTVEVKAETCKGCALCVKRCPMDALQLKVSEKARNKVGKAAVLNTDLCIGCGVCVHKCPSESLVLVRNPEITEPPQTVRDYMKHYLTDRKAAREKSQKEAT
jgi:electron transport complex protein RnfB